MVGIDLLVPGWKLVRSRVFVLLRACWVRVLRVRTAASTARLVVGWGSRPCWKESVIVMRDVSDWWSACSPSASGEVRWGGGVGGVGGGGVVAIDTSNQSGE